MRHFILVAVTTLCAFVCKAQIKYDSITHNDGDVTYFISCNDSLGRVIDKYINYVDSLSMYLIRNAKDIIEDGHSLIYKKNCDISYYHVSENNFSSIDVFANLPIGTLYVSSCPQDTARYWVVVSDISNEITYHSDERGRYFQLDKGDDAVNYFFTRLESTKSKLQSEIVHN